jgi:hypothetical protein
VHSVGVTARPGVAFALTVPLLLTAIDGAAPNAINGLSGLTVMDAVPIAEVWLLSLE